MAIMSVTKKNQHTFGVMTGLDRWSTHANWSDNSLYFDPGICCDNDRSFTNGTFEDVWAQYTFMKTSTHVVARQNTIEKINGLYTRGVCTRSEDFAIGWATGNGPNEHSTASFLEFVMYKSDLVQNIYEDIENNTMTFWGL